LVIFAVKEKSEPMRYEEVKNVVEECFLQFQVNIFTPVQETTRHCKTISLGALNG
jgi:hypothetical protein